jgi:hypothetical protein
VATVTAYPTLEHVAQEARPYPDHLLAGCSTGLALFAAAFVGHNDAIHFALAGMRGTCVDVDDEGLDRMRAIYPEDWSFAMSDAWSFAKRAEGFGERWDVVSVDTFTGDSMERSLRSLDLWTALARRLVTVTYKMPITDGSSLARLVPRGWRWSLFHRASSVYWLTLERESS